MSGLVDHAFDPVACTHALPTQRSLCQTATTTTTTTFLEAGQSHASGASLIPHSVSHVAAGQETPRENKMFIGGYSGPLGGYSGPLDLLTNLGAEVFLLNELLSVL